MAEDIASSHAGEMNSFEMHLLAAGEHLRRDSSEAPDAIDRACEELRAALALRAGEPRALALLGLAHFRRADFASALPIYSELVACAPANASYRLNLGLVHLKLSNAEAAIEELSRSRELDPSQPRTVTYLGLAYARRGLYDRAYQAFLLAGEHALASEMASHLSEAQREEIRAAVSEKRPGEVVSEDGGAREADEDDVAAFAEAEPEPAAEAEPEPAAEAEPEPAAEAEPEPAAEAEPEPAAEAEPSSEGGDAHDRSGTTQPAGEADVQEVALAAAAALFAPESSQHGHEADLDTAHDSDQRTGDPLGPAISRAVDEALPSAASSAAAARAAVGHRPPQPVSELATENLIRPEDGRHAFEIGAGGVLIVRVENRLMSRTEGVIVSGGDLAYEPATQHARGSATDEIFGGEERPMFIVSGRGQLVATPLGERFAAVSLDDDILYLREDLVYAFESSLQWENGFVPGSDSTVAVVQFRGQGSVAIRSRRPLISIKLMAERVLYVDAEVLAGWIGRVIPRVVAPAAAGEGSTPFVECAGEGVVLIDDPDSGVSGAS